MSRRRTPTTSPLLGPRKKKCTMEADDNKHHKRNQQVQHGLNLVTICLIGIVALVTIWKIGSHGGLQRFLGTRRQHHGSVPIPPTRKLRKKVVAPLLIDSFEPDVIKLPHIHHHEEGAQKRAMERLRLDILSSRRVFHGEGSSGTESEVRKQLLDEKSQGLYRKTDPES